MFKSPRSAIAISVCFLAAAAGLWVIFGPQPSPVRTAEVLGEHLVSGDLGWLYERSLEKDRKISHFDLALFTEFYNTFLRELLKGAKVESSSTVYAGPNKGCITITLSKSDGTKASFDCMAFVENDEMRFPLFDAMVFAYEDLKYLDAIPGTSERTIRVWKDVGPWLLDRGIEQFYVSQDDMMLSVRAMMPKQKN